MQKVGDFTAKLVDYGLQLTKDGAPRVTAKFKVEDEYTYWSGSFIEGKPMEITVETLVETFGFEGNDFSVLFEGRDSRALNTETDYIVRVEKNAAGYFNVKNVWLPGSTSKFQKNSKDEIVQAFEGLNVGGVLAEVRSKMKPKTGELPF